MRIKFKRALATAMLVFSVGAIGALFAPPAYAMSITCVRGTQITVCLIIHDDGSEEWIVVPN